MKLAKRPTIPTQTTPYKNFVEQLKAHQAGDMRKAPQAQAPKQADGARPERPERSSKRFGWSAPIVAPSATKNTNFSSMVKEAPRPQEAGTMRPATFDHREVRRMVSQVRRAKKARY